MRSKAKTINKSEITSLDDLPNWNYDGSSCYQAETSFSEVILKPVAYFKDPFRQGNNVLVLCESMIWKDTTFTELVPANSNFRHDASPIFKNAEDKKFWFGIEQEYSLLAKHDNFTT